MTNATKESGASLSEGDKKVCVCRFPLTFDVYEDDTVDTYIGCRGEGEGG